MNILIITAVFPPEQVVSAKLSFDIANQLSNNNIVTALSPKPTRPLGYNFPISNTKYNFKHIITDSHTCPQFNILGRLWESYSFGRQCYLFIKKHKSDIDLIYSNTWPLFAQYLNVKAANKYNIPIIVHVQDIYPESLINILPIGGTFLTKILNPIDKYILKRSDKIIAISDKMKSYLKKTRSIDDEKINVVPNWQDEKPFDEFLKQTKSNNYESDLFTFMYLGNIGPLAGIDILIDAYLRISSHKCRLIIAGSGSMKETLKKKYNQFMTNNIFFWDVPEGKVPEIQSMADILLLPVKKGGSANSIPSKLPAYMFSKKPIIASVDIDSDTSVSISKANCGWIVPPENPDLLAITMTKCLLEKREDLISIGQNGYKFAIKNFSKKTNLQKIITMMEQFLEN